MLFMACQWFNNSGYAAVGIKPLIFLCCVLPDLHIIFNFALNQATACSRRLICLAFSLFWFKTSVVN